jgi:predicted small secreted protein
MKKLYLSALFLCTTSILYAQNVVWQKDIKSSTQDFLSQVTTTIDQQYLITGSSIQTRPSAPLRDRRLRENKTTVTIFT